MKNKIPFQWKGYAAIIMVCGFYWLLDSLWSYLSFEYNLKKMIFSEPTAYLDTFLLRVSPYQVVSRIIVLLLFIVLGLIVVRFMTRIRAVDHERQAAHENLLNVMNSIDATIYVSDIENSKILFTNQAMIDRFGGDFTGQICYEVFRNKSNVCDDCKISQLLDNTHRPGDVVVWDDHNSLTGEWSVNHERLIDWVDGRTVHLQIAIDITQQKLAEDRLRISLHEKETLLQEIHHRVKNNMQIIISLLNIKRDELTNVDAHFLEDIIRRIRIFGDIHQRLYLQESNLAKIDFAKHIRESLKDLITTYSIDKLKIDLELDIEQPMFTLDQAVSCGLLLNELISNSLKHAFSNAGTIRIAISQDDDGRIESIIYQDNGKGFDNARSGFGTRIIHALAEQLELSVSMASNNGILVELNRKDTTDEIMESSGQLLYVEDELIIAMERSNTLRKNGYAVDKNIITSGEKAVEYVKNSSRKPSIILMDIGLKGRMNGIQAAEAIRVHNPTIPIIFLSGYEDQETQRRISEFPRSVFLNKMSSWDEIMAAIDHFQDA